MSRKVPVQMAHYCKAQGLTRKEDVITFPDKTTRKCKSISCAKRFMRTGKEYRA